MSLKKSSFVRFVVAVLFLGLFVLQLDARVQQRRRNDPFVSIPAEFRTQLRQRLKLFINFQRKRQWAMMYDLSIEPIQKSTLTRAEFVSNHLAVQHGPRVSTLLEFAPQSDKLTNEYGNVREWLIEGCAKYLRKGKVVYLKAGLNAGLSNRRLYFS